MAGSSAAIRAAQRRLLPSAVAFSPTLESSPAQRGSEGRGVLAPLQSLLVPVAATSARPPVIGTFRQSPVTRPTTPCCRVTATSLSSFAASGYVGDVAATWPSRRRYSVDADPRGGELVRLDHLTGEDEGIAVLTLNRPAARNAISRQLLADLLHAMGEVRRAVGAGEHGLVGQGGGGGGAGEWQVRTGSEAAKSGGGDGGDVRAVIIRSAVEGVFCAGADLKERKSMTMEEAEAFVSSLRGAFSALENLPVPTVAAVEGAALGGGLEMLLACDIRVAGFNARFGLPEASLAIIPGAGGTQRLPRLIGAARAKELIFTARVVRADEALSLGVVSHCVPAGTAYDTSLDIARAIQRNGPLAVRLAKEAVNKGHDVAIKDGLAIEERCYHGVLKSKDRLEGLAAFAEKRKPVYYGL
ncbi:hypothetical protein CLOM_g2689 [Closterium sp. NIES-68]|nr:hypothetical protein CLOM_g2689 [Closterium sp. NIES-68]GJP62459.1 hypothetical protein CLOP_g19518 [Closterium sp. NIES-67]